MSATAASRSRASAVVRAASTNPMPGGLSAGGVGVGDLDPEVVLDRARVGGLGVEAGAGGLHGPLDLGVGALLDDPGEVPVHVRGGLGRQRGGELGDPAGPPHGYFEVHDPGPQPGEPVLGLHRVADQLAARIRRHAQAGGELGDAELRDRGSARAGDLEVPLLPRRRLINRLTGVQRGPLGGELEPTGLQGGQVGLHGTCGTEDLVGATVPGDRVRGCLHVC